MFTQRVSIMPVWNGGTGLEAIDWPEALDRLTYRKAKVGR
jgi:hypothetical protein